MLGDLDEAKWNRLQTKGLGGGEVRGRVGS